MQPRLRRLISDQTQVLSVFHQHPFISCTESGGSPSERYRFEIAVPGLVPSDGDRLERGDLHRAEVFLPLDYPRRPPFCRMLTPVFHPNIDPRRICIGDHWSAAESLPQLVVRIAEMICFQSYNTKSPLNARAAAWVEQHLDGLPLLEADLSSGI